MIAPAIYCPSRAGTDLADRIQHALAGERVPNGPAAARDLRDRFRNGQPIMGVCAAGILIRILAPELRDKWREPPVLCVTPDGAHIVPLLGTHKGGGELASRIAAAIGGDIVLTPASDTRFAFSLDDPPASFTLRNPKAAKPVIAEVLNGAVLAVSGPGDWLAEAGYPLDESGAVSVHVGHELRDDVDLAYCPPTLVAGVGCERGTDADEVIALVQTALAENKLAAEALAAIATIDIKADEPALHAAAAHFGVPLRLFSPAELAAEEPRLANPSETVRAETGTPGVAEAAALKVGSLLVPKTKSARATCAIGLAPAPRDVGAFGHAPGVLHIVGIGPGEPAQRTAAARQALLDATDWVGYGLYLDLIVDLHDGQQEHRFELGEEEVRVRHALELAATGKSVALVSSGDAQIFAMATLAYELLAADGTRALSNAARRVRIETAPGISALQAASAAAGALIGHDFCAISLSDLLTDREIIRQRIAAAAAGDFVTAFYNPRSQRRTELLEEAIATLKQHRPAATPVINARALGRPDEQVEVVTLADFDSAAVDMLTTIIVGASTSQTLKRGNGRTHAFTPRGYAKKAEEGR